MYCLALTRPRKLTDKLCLRSKQGLRVQILPSSAGGTKLQNASFSPMSGLIGAMFGGGLGIGGGVGMERGVFGTGGAE